MYMAPRMTHVSARDNYIIYVEFEDGVCGEKPMASSLWGPMFEPLKDHAFFAQVKLDPITDAPVWPNGVDVSPDAIYEYLRSRMHGDDVRYESYVPPVVYLVIVSRWSDGRVVRTRNIRYDGNLWYSFERAQQLAKYFRKGLMPDETIMIEEATQHNLHDWEE